MKFKDKKGSISIFVLVALLFMASVLLLMFASSINKSKVVKEQFNTISGIYTYDDVDAYNKAYTELRENNKQISTKTVENFKVLEIEKGYEGSLINYKIYGSEDGLGDLIEDSTDANYGKYKIPIKVTGKNLFNVTNISDIDNGVYTIIINDNIRLTGTQEKCSTGKTLSELCPELKAGEMAAISFDTTSTKDSGKIISLGETDWEINESKEITQEMLNSEVYVYNDTELERTIISNIQVEVGDKATGYVKYLKNEYEIYIGQQLTKTEDITLYIDFKDKVINQIDSSGEITTVTDIAIPPEINIYEDYTRIEILTDVTPSKIEVEYEGYTLGD